MPRTEVLRLIGHGSYTQLGSDLISLVASADNGLVDSGDSVWFPTTDNFKSVDWA